MEQKIETGDIVQISPVSKHRMFAGCLAVVTEPKSFGMQGYVQSLGKDGEPGGQAYIRLNWDEFVVVGRAEWIAG